MSDWKPGRYLIDQGDEPKVEVEGYTHAGLGIKQHGWSHDAWVITHLGSGLRVVELCAETFEEVVIYADEIAASADWIALVKADSNNQQHRTLGDRISQIRFAAQRDFEERIRRRESGVLLESRVQ